MLGIFLMSARGVVRNWRQSLSTLISIAAGFASLALFQGYLNDVQKTYEDSNVERGMMGHFFIEGRDGQRIPATDQREIGAMVARDPRIVTAARLLDIGGQIANGRTSMIFLGYGHDVAEGEVVRGSSWAWNALAGEPLRVDRGEGQILLGRALARILDCDVDLPPGFMNGGGGFTPEIRPLNCPFPAVQLSLVTEKGQMNGIDVPVTGVTDMVYREIDERFLAIPLAAAQALMDTDGVTRYAVRVQPDVDPRHVVRDMNDRLATAGISAVAVRWQDHRMGDLYRRTMDLLETFRNFVITVIVLIACLSVLNTFIRNVAERSREIGTLRSLGYRPIDVLTVFMGEGATLALLGCGLGALVTALVQASINGAKILYKPGVFTSPVPFRVLVGAPLYLQTSAFLIALVVVAAWVSARNAVRRDIVESLGHV